MRVDEQITEIESETDNLITILRNELGGYKFQRLGNRQFQDAGRIYERRGAPATLLFVQSKIKETRYEEQRDYTRLVSLIKRVSEAKLDVHLKGFILRKLPTILPEYFGRQGGQR